MTSAQGRSPQKTGPICLIRLGAQRIAAKFNKDLILKASKKKEEENEIELFKTLVF
jgi:hypothetical protein